MTKKEFEDFSKAYDDFILECDRVVKYVAKLNFVNYESHKFSYSIKSKDVIVSYGHNSFSFPIKLLSYSNEALEKYVKKEVEKHNEFFNK